MTVHRFWMPDWTIAGGPPRMIDWDDAAGAVEGDHGSVEEVRRLLDGADEHGSIQIFDCRFPLPDARHHPAQFMRVLRIVLSEPEWDPEGLPASMRGVELSPGVRIPLPPGVLA